MKRFFIILFIFISRVGLSQTIISGTVIDSLTNEPIPYVHVFIENGPGTITNTEGAFLLKCSRDDVQDGNNLQFSCVGFNEESLRIDTNTNLQSLKVKLSQSITILNEVVIDEAQHIDSAYLIMKQVIRHISKNYSSKKFGMLAFYRESNIRDTTYSRLIESQVYIADKGYNSPIENTRIEVLQMRKSLDKRNLGWRRSLMEWLYQKNGVFVALANDRMKRSSKHYNSTDKYENYTAWEKYKKEETPNGIRFISNEFIHSVDLRIADILTTKKDTIYVIDFTAKKPVAFKKGLGQIYVSKSDWAVREINSGVIRSDTVNRGVFDETLPNSNAFYETVVKYRKQHDGKYYLSYVSSKNIGTNSNQLVAVSDWSEYRKAQGNTGKVYQSKEIFITDIKPYRKIKKSNMLDNEEDIYEEEIKNDTEFWATYSFPSLTPLTLKMKNDLSNGNNEIFLK